MHGIFTKVPHGNSESNVRFDANAFTGSGKNSEATSNVKSDGEWFSNACKHLLPNKAGTALHYTTGFDERSCQRYAAGHTSTPGDFLRALLRSPQGWTWLCATMDGSDAEWWREVRYAYELIVIVELKRGELREKYESSARTTHASQRPTGG